MLLLLTSLLHLPTRSAFTVRMKEIGRLSSRLLSTKPTANKDGYRATIVDFIPRQSEQPSPPLPPPPTPGATPLGLATLRLSSSYFENEEETNDEGGGSDLVGRTFHMITKNGENIEGICLLGRVPLAWAYLSSRGVAPLKLPSDLVNSEVHLLEEDDHLNFSEGSDSSSASSDSSDSTDSISTFYLPEDDKDDDAGISIFPSISSGSSSTSSRKEAVKIFQKIPPLADITLINSPLLTGITKIDVLVPIGRGQNMLVLGPKHDDSVRILGQRVIENVVNNEVKCVVAAVGDTNHPQPIYPSKTTVVHPPPAPSSSGSGDAVTGAEHVLTMHTAISIGTKFARRGRDSLVFLEDLEGAKKFWTYTDVCLEKLRKEKEDTDADYVVNPSDGSGGGSEMRGFYSDMIQRAGALNKENGGGTLTLLIGSELPAPEESTPASSTTYKLEDFEHTSEKVKARLKILADKGIEITGEILKKIKIPPPAKFAKPLSTAIPMMDFVDELISMSDGQIWLDSKLESQQNLLPPIDPQRSITRIGIGYDTKSQADCPLVRKLAGGMRFEISQVMSLDEGEVITGRDVEILKELNENRLFVMQQDLRNEGGLRKLSDIAIDIIAANNFSGLKSLANGNSNFLPDLRQFVRNNADLGEILKDIDATQDIREGEEVKLKDSIAEFLGRT